jgi:PTS system mannose-specific IIA component
MVTDSPEPLAAAADSNLKKVAGVIVTHGHLAAELLAAAEMIIGPISHITAVSIGWHDDVDAARDEVQRAMSRVSQGAGILLMTDMFGGTPTNIASMFLEEGSVEVVTGVNLPMVINLASQGPQETLNETARRVCDLGRQGMHVAGELLTPPPKAGKA